MRIPIIDHERYIEILHQNRHHIDAISEIARQSSEQVEGNYMFIPGVFEDSHALSSKQRNLYSLAAISNQILEIGFNAGHSSLIMLLASGNSKITAFDLCEHSYTQPCYKYLTAAFSNRIELVPGDSTITLPAFSKNNRATWFDLFHIDGGHSEDMVQTDFFNCRAMARDNSFVVLDDVFRTEVAGVWDLMVHMNTVMEIHNVLPTVGAAEHAVGSMINLCDPLENSRWVVLNNQEPTGDLFFGRLNFLQTSWGHGVWYRNQDGTYTASWSDQQYILTLTDREGHFTAIRQNDGHMIDGRLKRNPW